METVFIKASGRKLQWTSLARSATYNFLEFSDMMTQGTRDTASEVLTQISLAGKLLILTRLIQESVSEGEGNFKGG